MLLTLREDHKNHLPLSVAQPTQVLQDFCKLTLDYPKKGPNLKLYQASGGKLYVHPDAIRCAVDGLANLLVESGRLELSDVDWRDSVLALGFCEAQQKVLSDLYVAKKPEVRDALQQLQVCNSPHYRDLEWLFGAQFSSRALLHQLTPLITMKLTLEGHKCYILQTDPNNLVHMAQTLEEALVESRSLHA